MVGMTTLLTSLSYANFWVAPKVDVPRIDVPRIEITEIDTPEIKLPLIGKAKITNVAKSKTNITDASICQGKALCTTDTVIRVVDGDTIHTEHYQIRLALTDTPEKYENRFAEATAFTSNLCPIGSIISIDQDDGQKTDAYGRIIAKVICSGTNLNSTLLENDQGTIMTQYCTKSEFASEPWAKEFGC